MTNKEVVHGTIYAYASTGCRCQDCKDAARRYAKAYRQTETGQVASRRAASRNNFIRQEALSWVRRERPDLIGIFEAKWHDEKLD